MENRERDRVSQRATPTAAGDVNRRTEEQKGRDDGTSVEFGKNIGQSENLTSDTGKENFMNRDKDLNSEGIGSSRDSEMDKNKNSSNIGSTGRNSGSEGFGSSSGRGSSGSMGGNVSSESDTGNVSGSGSRQSSGNSGSLGSTGSTKGSSGSSEGRH